MSYEVTLAVTVKENSDIGALIQVGETETLFPIAVTRGLDTGGTERALLDGIFGQMELRVAAMADAVRDKATQQIAAHRQQVRDGTHPALFR